MAFALLIVTHWASNEPTISVKSLVEMIFAILFIAFLEQNAELQPIARGLAWLLFAAVFLSNNFLKNVLKGKAVSGVTVKPTGANIPTAPGFQAT